MDLRIADRRALVTGASAGIGEAIAKTLTGEGARVLVHGRDKARTEAVVAAIRAADGQGATALGDLATDEGAAPTMLVIDEPENLRFKVSHPSSPTRRSCSSNAAKPLRRVLAQFRPGVIARRGGLVPTVQGASGDLRSRRSRRRRVLFDTSTHRGNCWRRGARQDQSFCLLLSRLGVQHRRRAGRGARPSRRGSDG